MYERDSNVKLIVRIRNPKDVNNNQKTVTEESILLLLYW